MLLTRGNITQFDPDATGKVGVQAKYVDRKSDSVVHSFPEWMSLRPQLQIFRSVVRALAVDVMDVFVRSKWSAENTFHHYPMLVYGLPFAGDSDRSNDAGIAGLSLDVPAGFSSQKAFGRLSPLVRVATSLRTKTLLSDIHTGVRLAGGFVDVKVTSVLGALAAFFAGVKGLRSVALLRSLAPALSRAKRGVFAKALSVRAYVRRPVLERCAAICAGKTHHLRHSCTSSFGTWIMQYGVDNINYSPWGTN